MAIRKSYIIQIGRALFALCLGVVAAFTFSCAMKNLVENANDTIRKYLNGRKIYDRTNVPDDQVEPEFYDVIGGAYRYIKNEDRENRSTELIVREGDRISIMFEAKVFTGASSSKTFYTNIESVRRLIMGDNPNFDLDAEAWPVVPLEITVGSDPGILKSVQMALIGCSADDNDTSNDEDGIRSDEVEIYLTPDLAYGRKGIVPGVPPGSMLLWEVTGIQIIERNYEL